MTIRALSTSIVPAAVALCGCGEAEAVRENTVMREATSPDGELKAVLLHRASGGANGQASQVSVLAASQTETGKANAVVVDAASGAAPTAAWGGPDVKLHRSAPRALTLTYYGRSRIIACEPEVRGDAITHRSTD